MYTGAYQASCTNAWASSVDHPRAIQVSLPSLYLQRHSCDKIFQALSPIFVFWGPKVIHKNCACIEERAWDRLQSMCSQRNMCARLISAHVHVYTCRLFEHGLSGPTMRVCSKASTTSFTQCMYGKENVLVMSSIIYCYLTCVYSEFGCFWWFYYPGPNCWL